MVGREEQLLAVRVGETLTRAAEAEERYLSSIIAQSHHDGLDQQDEYHTAEELLDARVRACYRECQMLAERLKLPGTAADIRAELASLGGGAAKTTVMKINFDTSEHYCDALATIWSIYSPMAALALAGAISGLSVFETILRNSAKIIMQSGLEPEKEADVRNEVLRIVQLAFPDARKEIAIPKSFKTYKADLGVPSLFAAVEYKFVKTEAEMRNHIDQVFADMIGYSGHPDWRNFYAVLYQKRPFLTQGDVDQAFRETGASVNWTAMVLNGP